MSEFNQILPHLYCFEDTCNVYVLEQDGRALIIDCGSGRVGGELSRIGASTLEWILFTHHHRDQCSGAGDLACAGARLAVPRHERFLFDQVEAYWQQKRLYDNYNDRSTFFTLGEDVPVTATLNDYETFVWGRYTFYVLPAPGHTQGSVTLVAEIAGTRVAFTGDLIHDGGKLYQLHAMEYEYGDLVGCNWTAESIEALRRQQVSLALPAHGPAITDPDSCIKELQGKLRDYIKLQPDRLGATADGKFTHEVEMEQLSPHLLWGTENTCSNFYVVKSDSGKALLFDYPYSSKPLFVPALHSPEPYATLRFVEHHLDELREKWGVESFDLVIPTHIHDDHVCGIPHLQKHFQTRCWALEEVAKVLEAPERWNTPCLLEEPIRIDRRFQDGDRFSWEEFDFEIVFYPGQTEFHSAILGEIDGRRVFFSGDSTFPMRRYLPARKDEWMVNTVMRNSVNLAMHRKCAEEFDRLRPDFLCGGHGPVWDIVPEDFAAHRHHVEEKERIWRGLVPKPTDMGIDLFWARLLPYQATAKTGESISYTLELRNGHDAEACFEASLSSTLGLEVQPSSVERVLAPGERVALEFQVTVTEQAAAAAERRHLLTVDIAVDGKPHGPVTEALIRYTQEG